MTQTLPIEEMLAQLQQVRRAAPAEPTQTPPAEDAVASPAPMTPSSRGIEQLPLDQLTINLRQPRRVLPDDLRRSFVRGELSAGQVMATLVERAATANIEAQGHLAGLRPLADSIARIGVEQPILVLAEYHKTRTRYEIKDGERRFWACVLLAGDAPLASRDIPACIETDGADTDALMLSQWEINTQREAIPEVDFALLVRDTYRSMFDKVRANRDAICAAHEIAQTGRESDSDLAITLAIKEVDRLSGRPLQRRAVLQLTQCADKLAESAVRLARAYRFSQRSLAQLAACRLLTRQSSAERLASPTVAVAEAGQDKPRPARAADTGRP